MTDAAIEARSVIVEQEFPHPPETVWRALTQGDLIAEWLMENDFAPVVGHRFAFRATWGSVACEVREVEPPTTLSYSWSAFGLESVVTWTLTPTGAGTHVRMAQSGFRPDQTQAFMGSKAAWPRFFASLEQVVGRVS